jgi:TP901 family phage tail tape measure protein
LDVASLSIRVDSRQLSRGQRDLRDFGAQGERTGRQVEAAGGAATRGMRAAALAATAAIGALVSVGAAIRVITSFETSMSRLGAVSRATTGELEQLRDVAKQFGATTEFSATQAADGLNFLAMAGFSVSEAIASLPSVLDLATASGMGLAEAADTASNIMSGFGISAGNAAQVADVLAAASTRANTTVAQLGAAMSTVAPIASALDISLEDTAAAIGVLADAGIQGERAGTALRGVFASLAGPTSQAEEVLRGLGLTIEDVNPATNDLGVVMGRLGAAGLSTADAMTLFGREAASGALVLIEGAQRVGEFGDELERADGAAQTMAATMRDNLGGDLQGAASAAQGLAIALGDAGLTMAIRLVVQGITAIVRGFSDAVDAIGDFRGFVIAAALALTVVYAPAIIAATAATYAWVVSLFAVRGALIATGIGAFIVLAGLFLNKVISLIEQVGGLGDALGLLNQVAVEVFNRIGIAFSIIPQSVAAGADAMKSIFLQAVTDMLGGFLEMIQDVVRTINDTFGTDISAPNLAIDRDIYILNRGAADAATASAARLNATIAEVSAPLKSLEDMRAAMVETEERTAATAAEAAILEAELQAITDEINSGTSGAVTQLADDLDAAADSADSFANTFRTGITDALDYVLDGMQNGMAGLLDIFKRMLIDMIRFAVMNPINLQGGMNMAGGGGGGMLSSLAGGAGGGGGMLSSIGMGGGIAGSFMSGGAGLLTSLTGAGGGLASAGTYMSAVMGGATASLGGAAAALGAIALPLAAVFAVVSFFKSKTKVIDQGITGIISMEDAAFQSFKQIEKSRFFGLSKKRSTSFNTLTGEDSAPLDAAAFAVRESVIGATESLGVSIDIFDGFTHKFSLSLKGLDEAARATAITEEFTRMGDSLANLVPHITNMNELFAVAANRVSLTDRLLQAQGETEELTARIRGREMDATNELNKALLAQVFAAEDAAVAANALSNALAVSFSEDAFASGIDFRRGLARASNAIDYTPQQSQAEMLAQLKALNARIDVLQSTTELTANSSAQTAENTDFSNALTLEAAA